MRCCRGRGTSTWIMLGVAALAGAAFTAWNQSDQARDPATTLILVLGWSAAVTAVLAAPSGGCCCRSALSRLFRRNRRVENPYRDTFQDPFQDSERS